MSTKLPERDAEGYLIEPGDWSEEVAQALAEEENIPLNDDHWDAIRSTMTNTRSPPTPASSSSIWPSAWARTRTRNCSNCFPMAT